MDLVEEVYALTKLLPSSEQFNLISQTQRCSVSIPSNIAEGSKRNHQNEFLHFLSIAQGSAAELETQIILIQRLYPNLNDHCYIIINSIDEIAKILFTLKSNLRKSNL